MKHQISISIDMREGRKAESAIKSISHEEDIKKRSLTEISRENDKVIITIRSNDIVSLRACVNAYLRAFQIFEGIENNDE